MIGRALCLAALLAAGAASAAEVALVIGNARYDTAGDLRGGDEVVPATRALARAGVTIVHARDADADTMRNALATFVQEAQDADGMLVVLSGRFLSTATDVYLLPVENDAPSFVDLPAEALPVSLVLAALARAEGPALLVVATEEEDETFGRFVESGIGGLAPVEDVAIIATTPREAADLLERTLPREGEPLRPRVERRPNTRIIGELENDFAFIDRFPPNDAREASLWAVARDSDSLAAYRDYLEAFPNGAHALEARLRIGAIENDPATRARAAEDALALGLEARRQIQRNLSLLDYNTRGIDGIFGRGTRAAVSAWQEANGFAVTGYLDRSQIVTLDRQAAARSAELEAEAARRAAEAEAADRAWWDRTGALGGAANYRAYLERYPDGRYAEMALNRLGRFEEEKRGSAAAAERAAWERAAREDTIASYQGYLERYPNGAFRDEATVRRDTLRRGQADAQALAAAEAEEERMGLTALTARVVEERLNVLGLRPGPVDGRFDDATRRALRRYQQDRGIPSSGYLNEATAVRLLADSIGNLLR